LELPYSLLDPNPSLIDRDGNLNNNITLVASLTTYRNATIDDGISELLLLVYSNIAMKFSINGTKPDDLTNGTLNSLTNHQMPIIYPLLRPDYEKLKFL
jgi:hypothetical protein